MSRHTFRPGAAARSRAHFRVSANQRAPRAFFSVAALPFLLVPSFGCGLDEREGEEQTTAPVETGVVSTRRPPCQALSPTQEKTALKLIDDICGDTWCEGDNNFDFRALTCDLRRMTCTLRFQMFPWDTVASGSAAYSRSCETTGFSGFDSLVATAPNGYQSLVPSFYDALTTCIGKLEGSSP